MPKFTKKSVMGGEVKSKKNAPKTKPRAKAKKRSSHSDAATAKFLRQNKKRGALR